MTRRALEKIRQGWFKGSPIEKMGVTERYVIFGEARRWMMTQLDLDDSRIVLDVGSGHGFLAFELAATPNAHIVGVDLLGGEQMKTAKGGARLGELTGKISWVVADGRNMPFSSGSFDAVVSFLSLQDVFMIGREKALDAVINESYRVLNNDGILAFADNFYPECAKNQSQELYQRIHREELGARLPSKSVLVEKLREYGLTGLRELEYEPKLVLDEKESRIELMDIAEAKPFGIRVDFEKLWRKYAGQIRTMGMSYPNLLLILGRKPEHDYPVRSPDSTVNGV